MHFKDFFYFNRSQRTGMLVLVILIVLSILSFWLMPYFFKSEKENEEEDTKFLTEASRFKSSLVEKEKRRALEYQNKYRHYERFNYRNNDYSANNNYQLFPFDPNKADSATFVRLGIKSYIARNITKYRNKGGKFRKPEDFGKVYGLSPDKFNELAPYIQIDAAQIAQADSFQKSKNKPEAVKGHFTSNKIENITVDLNSADTTQLMQIKGIGRTYAKRIVGYRKLLGGYVNVEQLHEIYGMNEEIFASILPHLMLDLTKVQKIPVNIASIERLKSHPYIKTFQRAKALYEFRRKKVKLKNIEELKVLDEFSEEDRLKMKPYLSFE